MTSGENPLDFHGRVVLVTGGVRGVGRGITDRFLAAGATVVCCGRHEPDPGDAAGEFVVADVRDPEQVAALVGTIVQSHGRLDVAVNNAGGSPAVASADASPRFSESIIRLNLVAPLHVAREANAVMQAQAEGGVIINIGSVSGERPSPATAAYGAAKAGLANLTETLAVEWAPKVRVNLIVAGMVGTERSELFYGDAAGIAAVGQTVPMGRLARPDEIGDACLFVASPLAAYMTGGTLRVHGGGERPAYLDRSNADLPVTRPSSG